MARIADFVAIQDHGSTLPHPQTGSKSVQLPAFNAPDVSGAPAILGFRLESTGEVVLKATLNGILLFEQPLKAGATRSWHEVISTSIVQAAGNKLTLAMTGQGSVTVSDVVLHYQAWAPAHPIPIIAAQNTRYSQPLSCGARTGVIVIRGSYFLQLGLPSTQTMEAFLGKSFDDVKGHLESNYLADHPEVGTQTTEILMMDVEDPHPKDLHTHTDPAERAAIVGAYRTRIAALRAVFPNAKLCMYGTLNPDGRGRPDNPQYLARLEALKEAGDNELYDELDYLAPILYPRFGPNDPIGAWKSYRAYTEQGIDGSRQLLKSDKTSLPVLPVTGFRIANDNPTHKDQLLLDLPVDDPLGHTLRVQLEVMAEKGVQNVVFWVGKDSDLLEDPNPRQRTVTQHVCAR
jgi:hypothetical protein